MLILLIIPIALLVFLYRKHRRDYEKHMERVFGPRPQTPTDRDIAGLKQQWLDFDTEQLWRQKVKLNEQMRESE